MNKKILDILFIAFLVWFAKEGRDYVVREGSEEAPETSQDKLNKAISREDYREASRIKKRMDKAVKKQKPSSYTN